MYKILIKDEIIKYITIKKDVKTVKEFIESYKIMDELSN